MTRAERVKGHRDPLKLPRDPLKVLVQPGRTDGKSILHLQQTLGNAAFARLLLQLHAQRGIGDDEMPAAATEEAEPEVPADQEPEENEEEGGPAAEENEEEEEERLVAAARTALEHKDEEPARNVTRDGAGGELHPPDGGTATAVTYPNISTIKAAGPVTAAIEADWTASESDYKERAGWVMWETSGAFSVTGKATGSWDRCTPTPKPADTATQFHVGHYHIHPTLPPAQQPNTASWPIGPSTQDTGFATSNGSPGFVKDFNTTARKKGDTTYYNYGPTVRT